MNQNISHLKEIPNKATEGLAVHLVTDKESAPLSFKLILTHCLNKHKALEAESEVLVGDDIERVQQEIRDEDDAAQRQQRRKGIFMGIREKNRLRLLRNCVLELAINSSKVISPIAFYILCRSFPLWIVQ